MYTTSQYKKIFFKYVLIQKTHTHIHRVSYWSMSSFLHSTLAALQSLLTALPIQEIKCDTLSVHGTQIKSVYTKATLFGI